MHGDETRFTLNSPFLTVSHAMHVYAVYRIRTTLHHLDVRTYVQHSTLPDGDVARRYATRALDVVRTHDAARAILTRLRNVVPSSSEHTNSDCGCDAHVHLYPTGIEGGKICSGWIFLKGSYNVSQTGLFGSFGVRIIRIC